MQNSSEIKEAMLKIYQTMCDGQAEEFSKLVSRESGALVIGTDPREWWSGYDTINRFFGVQVKEMGGTMQIGSSHMEAFSEGSVGWMADQAVITLNDGTRIPFRTTGVFHQEDGKWMLVQWHSPVGSDNAEVVGRELTV